MRPFLLLIALCSAMASFAQHTITGRVIDASSHEPLAFVPFVIDGTRTGTTADIDGRFSLAVGQLPATIRVSYVGYDAQLLTVTDDTPLNVALVPSNTQLGVVEILPTENPAHRIIRRVYAQRKENDGMRYHNYRYTSYSKTIFTAQKDTSKAEITNSLDTTAQHVVKDTTATDTVDGKFTHMLETQHILLIESATKKSFIPPSAEKEEVLAMRVSGLKDPSLLGLAAQTKTFSIYDPQITISEKNYLGPIGPSSTNKYYFHLEDTLYQDADSVYVISYRPRKGTKFDGLKGLLYINTNGYAVQNVTAEPVEKKGMSIRFQQKHERLATGEVRADGTLDPNAPKTWFPVQLNTFIYASGISINGLGLYGVGRTYLKDIQLDVDIARKEVRGPELVMDQLSIRRDDAYWDHLRADSLDSKDLRTYTMMDSLGEAEHFDRKLKALSALASGRFQMGKVDLILDRILNYNDYEGFRLGAGLATNDKITRYGSLGGYFGYGFKDQGWKYGGDLTIKPIPGRDLHVKFSYENDLSETGGVAFPGQPHSFNAESYRWFYVDRFDRIERFAGEVMVRAGSSLKMWFGTERAQRVNDIGYRFVEPEQEGVTLKRGDFLTGAVTVGMRWAFHERLARLPDRELSLGTKWPVVYVQAMQAVKGLYDGDVDTWRVNAMVEKTFRIRLAGDLSVRVLAGVADPHAPMPFLFNLRGTGGEHFQVSADNTFETMHPDEFLADRYVSMHVKHAFGSLLTKGKRFRPKPSILASAAFGEMSHPEEHEGLSFKAFDQGYYEAGVRIDDVLKLGFTGIGVGALYRLGPYAFADASDNIALKIAITVGL